MPVGSLLRQATEFYGRNISSSLGVWFSRTAKECGYPLPQPAGFERALPRFNSTHAWRL